MKLSIPYHRRYRCLLSIVLLALSLSSYYGCEGFSTTKKNTLAFSSFSNTKIRTVSSDDSSLYSIPRGYRQPVYCSRIKTSIRSGSLFSSSNKNNENNDENSDPDSALSSSSKKMSITSLAAKLPSNNFKPWSKQFVSDVYYGSLMVHQNYLQLFWNIIVKKTFICALPFVIILLIFPCWEPTMKIAKFTHQLLIGTLTPIAISFTKFMSIILLPVEIAILLFFDPVVMWKLILNLPKELLRTVTSKDITRGFDVLPGMRQQLMYFFPVIIAPSIEEIVFRHGFYKLWQSTVGRILMRKDSKDNKTDNADNKTPSPSSSSKRIWLGRHHQTWVLVSSICFGLSHLSNHLPLNQDLISEAARILMTVHGSTLPAKFFENWGAEYAISSACLIHAIFQVVITTSIALEVFSPVFLERGLGASIGAHMMYNLNAMHNQTSITVRLLVRLCRKIILIFSKNKANADGIGTDSSSNNDANEEDGSK
jgi:membrane protease YdiL (CAAX protease family)